jgi:hypothetical protein
MTFSVATLSRQKKGEFEKAKSSSRNWPDYCLKISLGIPLNGKLRAF